MKNIIWWKILTIFALLITVSLGTLHFFKFDIFYETDIARDFLLLEDMVLNNKISLIGGRSSMPGVFHGPLYYWLALPFFAISGGNPLVVSFLWLLLYWLFLGSYYYIGKKTVDEKFALISTTFIATLTAFLPFGFTHTVIANFLIMPLIYFVYLYLKENKIWQLIASVFISGLIIQFQMAFGVPMLILMGGYVAHHILKNKNYIHLLAGLVIIIPLSTFIMFDLRHDFIQIKSTISYLTNDNKSSEIENYFLNRLHSINESFNVFSFASEQLRSILSITLILSLGILLKKSLKSNKNNKTIFILNTFCIFGFWIITIPFQGNVWPQYYRPLLPIIIFNFTYFLLNFLPKKVGLSMIALFIGSNLIFAIKDGFRYIQSSATSDEIHWKFYRQMANDIFTNNNHQPFSYFTFSPDQYAYQAKYALKYFSKEKNIEATPFQKGDVTYLIIAPNDHKNPWANEVFWQNEQVKISKQEDKIWTYNTTTANSYTVKKFLLDKQELSIKADPNLIDGIQFR